MSGLTLAARWFQNKDIVLPICVSSDGALVTISYNTEQTHSGRFFFASVYSASVANNSTLDLIVNTSTIAPHFGADANSGGQGTLGIYEAATTSSDGTPVTIFNANRQSALISTQTIFTGPTVTGTGTNLITDYVSGGSGGRAVGGNTNEISRITEFVAKISTKYLIRFTNTSGQTQPCSLTFGFFEGDIA